MNRLNVQTLTPELLAGPTFELMKGTCKSLTELEYFCEEVYKATTEKLDWDKPVRVVNIALICERPLPLSSKTLEESVWSQRDKAKARCHDPVRLTRGLKSRRDMRSLEKFCGGRPYGGDLRASTKDHMIYHMLFSNLKKENGSLQYAVEKLSVSDIGDKVMDHSDDYAQPLPGISMSERFNTSAGNPVKKILLKLNLSDHRLCKMVVEVPDSSWLTRSIIPPC
ncbi:hypothetical protein Tco_0596299 [Tanacetum coccineum]